MLFRSYDKALVFSQKCLDVRLKTLGGEHPDVASTYCIMGIVWYDKGENDKALEFYQKCLDIRLKTLGGEHPDVANSYYNVGSMWYGKGEYYKALEIYQKGFKILRKSIFPSKIAELYEALGNKHESLNYYIQSASIRKDDPLCGLNDKSTLESIENCKRLAVELRKEGDLPEWMN